MKKYRIGIFTPLVLASSLLIIGCEGEGKAANVADLTQYTQQGTTYLSQSQFKAAINSANNAVSAYPEHIEGYLILAKIYNKLGQSNQSIDILTSYKGEKNSGYYLLLLESYLLSNKAISANKIIEQHSDYLSQDENQFKLLQAKLFLLEKNNEQALLIFNELQQIPTFKADGFIGAAQVAATLNNKNEVLILLDQALQIDEKNIEALMLKGFLLMGKGQIEEAENTLSFALTVIPSSDIFTPERIGILKALTIILTSQGRSSEALLYSRVLSDEFPTASIINEHYISAQEYYKRKQTALAKKELYKILKIDAQNKQASTMLGVILYTEGDIIGAEKYLSGMIDPEVNSPQLTQVYAMTQLKLNQSNDVLAILDGVIDQESRLDTLILYAIAAISEKQFDKVDITIARIEKLFPDSPKLALLKSTYITAKTPEQQQQVLNLLATSLEKNNLDLSLQTAYLKKLIEMKEIDKADEFVKKEANNVDNPVGTRLLIANYYLYRKQFSLAEQHFNEVIKISNNDLQAYYGLAQSKQIQKKWTAAFKEYDQIISLYPDQIRAYYGAVVSIKQQNKDPLATGSYLSSQHKPSILAVVLADYQYQNKQLEEADKLIKTALDLPVELKDKVGEFQQQISNERIIIAIRTENYPVARELVLAQLQLTPEQPLFLMRLASIETLSGQYTEAEKVLQQIESMLPDNPQVVILQVRLALAQKNKVRAEQLLNAEWTKNGQDVVAIELYNFYKTEDTKKAGEFLNKWKDQTPDSVYANLNSAMLLQSKGDNLAAIAAYEKVLLISPNQLASLNNAAWLYSLSGDSKAEGLAARAYKVAPNNGAVLDTYGWILYKAGKYEQAKPLIKKALELLPDDAEIQKHWSLISNK